MYIPFVNFLIKREYIIYYLRTAAARVKVINELLLLLYYYFFTHHRILLLYCQKDAGEKRTKIVDDDKIKSHHHHLFILVIFFFYFIQKIIKFFESYFWRAYTHRRYRTAYLYDDESPRELPRMTDNGALSVAFGNYYPSGPHIARRDPLLSPCCPPSSCRVQRRMALFSPKKKIEKKKQPHKTFNRREHTHTALLLALRATKLYRK